MKNSCPFHESILTLKNEQIMNKPLKIEILWGYMKWTVLVLFLCF